MQKPDAQKTSASGFVDIFAGAKSIYGLCPFDIASLRYDINPTRPAGHIEWYTYRARMRISKILSGIYID